MCKLRNRKDAELEAHAVTGKELEEKFSKLSSRINLLLAEEAPVRNLPTETPTKVDLEAGKKCHFRVWAKRRPLPFKALVNLTKGAGFGEVLVSHWITRPNSMNCDKAIPLGAKEVFVTYVGPKTGDTCFAADYVFLTLEAERELQLTLECNFGRSTPTCHPHRTDKEAGLATAETRPCRT